MKAKLFLVLLTSLFFCACGGTLTVDNSVVGNLELNRFLGDWYEIARFDHTFEMGMQETKANYALKDDGTIAVTNQGMKNGEPKTANGKAKLTDVAAVLRVSFFGPFYSDYRVMLIDEDYQYALIGSGSDDYLWILSRTPRISDEVKQIILNEARRRGYDVSQLIWVEHTGNVK